VTTFRHKVERRSGPVLVLLSRLPRIVPFLLVFGLLLGGLVLENAVGGVLLLLVAALLAWLLFLAWPMTRPPQRLLRGAVVVLVIASALQHF
jgi:hypothetical protein